MALNFPNSPSDGDIYAVNGITYRYNSTVGAWLILSNVVTGNLSVSGTISGNSGIIAGSMNVEPTVQAVFSQANTIYLHANAAFEQANTARDHANAAYNAANNAVTDYSPAFEQANTAREHANTAHLTANAAFDQANTARNHANAAFEKANTGTGGGGGITYIIKTADYTANSGDGIIADTSNGSFNVTLPVMPNVGTQIVIADGNDWAANTLTILRNGSTIEGVADDLELDIAGAAVTLVYDGNTWETYYQVGIVNLGQTIYAFNQANAAFLQANTARTHANAAHLTANAAFDTANSKFSSNGGTIIGDVNIVGNLTMSGNTAFINVSSYRVDDPLIYLAGNNYSSDLVDIGFIGNYVNATGQNVHTGLYREHEDKMYYLFQGYDQEPINNHIGAMSNNMTLAVLNADLVTSNLTLAGTNTVIWIRSSYTQANTARDHANVTFTAANAAFLQANNAYDAANSALESALAFAIALG